MPKFLYEPNHPFNPEMGSMKDVVPQWYKDIEKFMGGIQQVRPTDTRTIKTCVPFLDTLLTGYYIPLHADVLVDIIQGVPSLTWNYDHGDVVQQRTADMAPTLPTPAGHLPMHLVWRTSYALQVPKGYSLLITHPLNRFDLPFTTLGGIVDGGWAMYGGSVPFFLKESFKGVIPAGTPIAQVIPFKTENWKSEKSVGLAKEANINAQRSSSSILNWYRNLHWSKKVYK